MESPLIFELSPQFTRTEADLTVQLISPNEKTLVKSNPFNFFEVFTRCAEKNKYGQSFLGVTLYVFTLCINFYIGYSIYRAQDIKQTELSGVDLFGDLCMVGFLAFCFINFSWHGFEKLTCLGAKKWCRCTREFFIGLGRYIGFVVAMLGSTAIYGSIRNIAFFQTSLNSDLTNDQWWTYFGVFTVVVAIIIYWLVKLFAFEWTKRCCRPEIRNRLIFVRVFLAVIIANVLSFFVCQADETCDFHLHHFHFGLCLVVLSTCMMDNWLDMVLQAVFWMFVLESQWNWSVNIDRFFI